MSAMSRRPARDALRAHREALRLSVRAAALQLHVSHVALLSWERGLHVPFYENRVAIERWSGGSVAVDAWPEQNAAHVKLAVRAARAARR